MSDEDNEKAGLAMELKEIRDENPYKPCERQISENGDPTSGLQGEKDIFPIRVYTRRWFILGIVALLNFSNTLTWIAYAAVTNHANVFYNGERAGYFSTVYIGVSVPVGIIAIYLGRKFGLRFSILFAASVNAFGAALRLVASFIGNDPRFYIAIVGQGIAATAYPFIMFLPTKLAAAWFAESQRGLATTIGVMANPLGVLIANVLSPRLVGEASDIPWLNAITTVPALMAAIAAFVIVKTSEPKIPPSYSASQEQMDFFSGVKSCFQSVQYIILLFVMGGGIGMFNTLYTVMAQLLCASGYSNSFAGACAACMILGGTFGATSAGILVDKWKCYTEVMKIAMGLAVVCGLIFLQLTLVPSLSPAIIPAAILFGLFGLATYPVGLQMSAECTYPVSEETSSGLVVLMGQVCFICCWLTFQILSVVFVIVMNSLYRPLEEARMSIQKCTTTANPADDKVNKPYDATVSIMVFSFVAAALAIALILFFKPVYKRTLMEQNRGEEDKNRELNSQSKPGALPNVNQQTAPLKA